jgi:hypothetical protein
VGTGVLVAVGTGVLVVEGTGVLVVVGTGLLVVVGVAEGVSVSATIISIASSTSPGVQAVQISEKMVATMIAKRFLP